MYELFVYLNCVYMYISNANVACRMQTLFSVCVCVCLGVQPVQIALHEAILTH